MIPKPQAVMDLECYPNYFLCNFLRCSDDKIIGFERTDDRELDVKTILGIITKYEIITFNGNHYDLPMLALALMGASPSRLKVANDDIIVREMSSHQFYKKYNLQPPSVNHIDLKELPIGQSSLKIYAGRIHCKKMQDLPYADTKYLSREEMNLVREYCGNDLVNTKLLLTHLEPQITLRRQLSNQYKVDLRSKSDAQIAEAVIKSEIVKSGAEKPAKVTYPDSFLYQIPEFIKFETGFMDDTLDILRNKPFIIQPNGKSLMPVEMNQRQIKVLIDQSQRDVKMGQSVYQMGMGGLHSTEKSVYHIADKKHKLISFDVTSYYPFIILNLGMYPPGLGPNFLPIYRHIVETRIAAKKIRDMVVADCLRVTVNGSFGKLGSPYSGLYAPELLVQTTITGQLALLMPIERLELAGIPVISANTDGIVLKCPVGKEEEAVAIIKQWELETKFQMDREDFTGLYSRDVNNYVAVKLDGEVKTKGAFKVGGLMKNPTNEICSEAMIKYLTEGVEVGDTIRACTDIRKFITVRAVKGGALWQGQLIGKALRWAYKRGLRTSLTYRTTGNTVPRSFGAQPVMELPEEFPDWIDYDWYEAEAKSLLCDVGLKVSGQQGFDF